MNHLEEQRLYSELPPDGPDPSELLLQLSITYRRGLRSPTRRERSTFFRLRTMASDLEELPFIAAVNRPRAAEAGNRTTSSANSSQTRPL